MAKPAGRSAVGTRSVAKRNEVTTHMTSIGHSSKSRPKNKHKRRQWKPYKKQGKRR